jgi:hypothetical protein
MHCYLYFCGSCYKQCTKLITFIMNNVLQHSCANYSNYFNQIKQFFVMFKSCYTFSTINYSMLCYIIAAEATNNAMWNVGRLCAVFLLAIVSVSGLGQYSTYLTDSQ